MDCVECENPGSRARLCCAGPASRSQAHHLASRTGQESDTRATMPLAVVVVKTPEVHHPQRPGRPAPAVAAIPAPRIPQPHQREEESWEHIGSRTCTKACHLPSSAGNTVTMKLATANDENPCGDRGLDVVCPSLAIDGTDGEKWRRRESNLTRNHRETKGSATKAAQNAAH